MRALSVFESVNIHTADGMVVGPACTDHQCRELLRFLRLTQPAAPDSPDEAEQETDVLVAARVFHEVLTLSPAAARWPVFSGSARRSSLFKSSVTHAYDLSELTSLVRLSDHSALLAANIARWLLRLPQQHSATMVFASPPPSMNALPPRPVRSRYATAIALAS